MNRRKEIYRYGKAIIAKYQRFGVDVLLNLVGTFIPIAALQLLIYPGMARTMSSDEYGLMQSLMSIVYLCGGTFGGALSTYRLVSVYEYERRGLEGDFQPLFLLSEVLVLVVLPIAASLLYVGDVTLLTVALVSVIGILCCAANYLEVGFRLKIDFRRILESKVALCIGYLVGYLLFIRFSCWELAMLLGMLFQVAYLVANTSLMGEPLVKTELFGSSVASFTSLSVSSLLSKALTYIDKVFIYPLLGGTAVSIYYAANLLGKLVMQALEPIDKVMLSYLAKRSFVDKATWKIAILVGTVFCAAGYVFCLLASGLVLEVLYPQWKVEAMRLVPVSTLTLCISALTSFLNPFALKTVSPRSQILFNATSLACYAALVFVLVPMLGLVGSCLALLASYLVRLCMMIILCIRKAEEDPA